MSIIGVLVLGLLVQQARLGSVEGVVTSSEQTIRDIVDSALVAPPELAADILLKLIERGHISDSKWKREVLDIAWNLAPLATYPFEIEPALETSSESEAASLSTAVNTGLSTAALQARIISQVARLDAKEAREMFRQMHPPEAESPSCATDRYTSHRAYFQALKTAANTFSVEEIRNGDKAVFLTDAFRFVVNPEDFELSLDILINEHTVNDTEFQQLMMQWAGMLAEARFPDRLFSSRSLDGIATPLLYRGDLRVEAREDAFRALRSYLVRHAHADRCRESESKTVEEEGLRLLLNKRIAPRPAAPPKTEEGKPDPKAAMLSVAIPLISIDDIKAGNFGDSARIMRYSDPNDSRIQEMKSDYSHLRFADEAQRGGSTWNEEALQFLNKLERWSKPLGHSNREFLFEKAQWYGALVYAAGDGELRHLFLDSYVKFLVGSPVERESPPEWLMWLNRLIGAADIGDRKAWLDAIQDAGDSTIAVYCRLERLKLRSAEPCSDLCRKSKGQPSVVPRVVQSNLFEYREIHAAGPPATKKGTL
jgi:hypothetical protein